MASRGLAFPNPRAPKLYLNQPNEEIKIPSFLEFVNFINNKSPQPTENVRHHEYTDPSSRVIDALQNALQPIATTPSQFIQSNQYTGQGQKFVSGYRSEVYMNILRFLRNLMIVNADPTALVDELADELDGESKLFDSNTRTRVKYWIRDQWKADQEITDQMDLDEPQYNGALNLYLGLIEKGLSNKGQIGKRICIC
jgi:hypothetical protein